ncbi:MAG: hypothetical protein AAFY03_03335 [Pseudomonadota bacterium]
MRTVLDGAASLFCALATIGLCGVPIWGSHMAISVGVIPQWIYAPLGIFGFLAILLAFDFVRKGFSGIGPMRERRR